MKDLLNGYDRCIQELNEARLENAELRQRLKKAEADRDALKGAYILLDGLKRRIREAFESWPELAGFRDISVLLNLKASRDVVKRHNIEQRIKELEGILSLPLAWDEMNASGRRKIRQKIEQLRKELEK